MKKFKAFPEVHVEVGMVDGLYRIETNSGRVIASGAFPSKEDAERFAECWNACRRLYAPIAHMEATEDYVRRLEINRRDAVAQLEVLANGWRLQ